jgi:ribosomal peptide maturation radical SAM protein 1
MKALIIVPPFNAANRPSLAAHLLQACARQHGHDVHVAYANLSLASRIGAGLHQQMAYTSASTLIGERLFARRAYGLEPLGARFDDERATRAGYAPDALRTAEAQAFDWCEQFAEHTAACSYDVVGCSSTFEQNAASIALLGTTKRLRPEVTTILGGANCDGQMADGLLALAGDTIDFVFSGESEATLPAFLSQLGRGAPPEQRVIRGEPTEALDLLPCPDYTEYFEQLSSTPGVALLADDTWIPYESSRGCWWGEKHHCTFCGINGTGMAFREKRPARVVEDLRRLRAAHGVRNICMVDNIMPHRYFRTLLPELASAGMDLHIFYEQKANLTLSKVELLHAAGVMLIQPGIEALSTKLLKLMDKGVTARQNVDLLRYARATGVSVNWNLLWDFPGDTEDVYETTLALAPLLAHLQPPTGFWPLSIERFSPYFDRAAEYGVDRIEPVPSYRDVCPVSVEPARTAYHFVAAYPSGARRTPALIDQLRRAIDGWRSAWGCADPTSATSAAPEQAPKGAPYLGITRLTDTLFLALDTRPLAGAGRVYFLDAPQARALLSPEYGDPVHVQWALDHDLIARVEGELLPLAVASPVTLRLFEKQPDTVDKRHLAVVA